MQPLYQLRSLFLGASNTHRLQYVQKPDASSVDIGRTPEAFLWEDATYLTEFALFLLSANLRGSLTGMTEVEMAAIARRIAEVDRAEQARRIGFSSGEQAWRMLREAQKDRRLLLAELRDVLQRGVPPDPPTH
jgi:hypothetical protein